MHVCGVIGIWCLLSNFHTATVVFGVCLCPRCTIDLGRLTGFFPTSLMGKKPLELFLVLFSAAAFQSSIIEWVYQHRMHHEHSDTDKDPYSVEHGFWWAHMGWNGAPKLKLIRIR